MAINGKKIDDRRLSSSAFPNRPGHDPLDMRLHAQRLLEALFGIEKSTQLGRYELLEKLGEGATASVYAAHDRELDRQVAIKVLRSSLDAPELAARLLREARAMARVSHPNVITVFDTDAAEGLVFIVMEYVEGMTLRDWLDTRQRSHTEILEVFVAAGEGLAAAHDRGVIHRDFKPANVLVGNDGHPRVLDFGLACVDPSVDETVQCRTDDMSIDSLIVGTPAYMAPEQFRGGWVDARSDQFAFCVALYEALYGEHPFGTTRSQIWTAAEHEHLRPSSPDTRVPSWLRNALLLGLSADPEHRYPSLRKLLVELAAGPQEQPDTCRRSLRITFSLDYDIEKIDEIERNRLQDLLRIVTGDRLLAIEDIMRGSIIVTVSVSERGAERLQNLYESNELSDRLGMPVASVALSPRPELSDGDLLRKWKEGDTDIGKQLVLRWSKKISSYFKNWTDTSVAQTLTQETLRRFSTVTIRLSPKAIIKGDRGHFLALENRLYAIAQDVLLTHIKATKRRPTTDPNPPPDTSPSPSSSSDEPEHLSILRNLIHELPLEDQELIKLHYWEKASFNELSQAYRTSSAAMMRRMLDIHQKLQILASEHSQAFLDNIDFEQQLSKLSDSPYTVPIPDED